MCIKSDMAKGLYKRGKVSDTSGGNDIIRGGGAFHLSSLRQTEYVLCHQVLSDDFMEA